MIFKCINLKKVDKIEAKLFDIKIAWLNIFSVKILSVQKNVYLCIFLK